MARKGLGSPFYKEDHIVFHLQLYVQQRQSPAYAFLQRESCSAPPALMPHEPHRDVHVQHCL